MPSVRPPKAEIVSVSVPLMVESGNLLENPNPAWFLRGDLLPIAGVTVEWKVPRSFEEVFLLAGWGTSLSGRWVHATGGLHLHPMLLVHLRDSEDPDREQLSTSMLHAMLDDPRLGAFTRAMFAWMIEGVTLPLAVVRALRDEIWRDPSLADRLLRDLARDRDRVAVADALGVPR